MYQSKSCQLLHNIVGTTCTTNPEQIEVIELEGYSRPTYNKLVHSATTRLTVVCVMGLLQLRYEHDSSTIRLRFGYSTLQHATRFFVRSHTRSYTRISGRRVLHVDWQLKAHSFYFILYVGLPYIVCVNMPEIVYTNAIKCQYAEYTINHCEIIVMLKWKTCDYILRAFIACPLHVKLSERLSVTLRYLATGTKYEKYTVNHIL